MDRQLEAIKDHLTTEKELIALRKSKIPVLVCTGDEDVLTVPANSEYIAKILEAPLKVFRGCGHVLNIQEPELYNQMLLEHFCAADVSMISSA